jgi:type I restriction enzyme S subunit
MKQSEKMSLPNGWLMKTVGDVCLRGSSNVSQNQLENEVGDYPIFGASGLIKNVSFYHQEKPYLSIVKDGSGFGRVTKMNAYTSVIGTLQYILPKEDIDLNYLFYNLISIDFKKYVQGAAIPHIYFKDYQNEPFLWMPLSEQQHIVAILDEAFAAIAKAKANAQQNLKNAKELFESYLQGVFENKGEGWEEKTLGEMIEIKNGKNQQAVLSENGEYKIMGSAGNVMGYATDFICEAGTTIIGRKGNISKPLYINERFWNVDTAFGFYPKNEKEIDKRFVYYLCLGIDFKSMNRGTTIPSLVKSELQTIQICFPKSLKIQQTIVKKLDALIAETQKLEAIYIQKLNDLQELKKSLLQKAFSGELKTAKTLV